MGLADAENAVPRIIAAQNTIFMVLTIVLSPSWAGCHSATRRAAASRRNALNRTTRPGSIGSRRGRDCSRTSVVTVPSARPPSSTGNPKLERSRLLGLYRMNYPFRAFRSFDHTSIISTSLLHYWCLRGLAFVDHACHILLGPKRLSRRALFEGRSPVCANCGWIGWRCVYVRLG